MSRRNTLPDASSKSMWYFYNPNMVTQGISEFEQKWGRRNLEDNWRRKNKGTSEMLMANDEDEETEGAGKKIKDVHTPEYYLQDIPLTDSMMMASHRKLEGSLYDAGYIYNNDLGEYAMSAEQYENLVRRYKQSDYTVPSYYYLYLLYKKLGKTAESEKYKNILLTEAPESVYAKTILDPDYLNKMAQQSNETEQLYEQTYIRFNNGEYATVIALADNALERFPKDRLASKFAYLKGLSVGRLAGTDEAMRNEMKKITADYHGTEISKAAQNLIDFLDLQTPEMKQAEQVERAKTLYKLDKNDVHWFVWFVDRKESINQLWFDLQNFSYEHFINDRLDFERKDINAQKVLLIVKSFSDFQRTNEFYIIFVKDSESKKNIKYEYSVFLISKTNYATMEEDGNINDYIEFFKKEYAD